MKSTANNTLSPHFKLSVLACAIALLISACGSGTEEESPIESTTESETETETETEWLNYEVVPPSEPLLSQLTVSPYLYPKQTCTPIQDSDQFPQSATIKRNESGQEELCVWESVIGAAPEGESFSERVGCDLTWTQAPSWFVPPSRVYQSDPALLDDPQFTEELQWVRSQVRSSGCSCCHGSSNADGYATGFDLDAPLVSTDSIATYRIAMLSGMFDSHRKFGVLAPEENQGFIRQHTMFPTTDPDRMRRFFMSELDRRGATDEDLEKGREATENFFGRRIIEDKDCISPFEGLKDNRVVWNDMRGIRQLYVLEVEADIPGFPPFNDQPEGIVWGIYVNPEEEEIKSGELTLGESPESARQIGPAADSLPELVEGRTYRLYATPDFMRRFVLNCIFEY